MEFIMATLKRKRTIAAMVDLIPNISLILTPIVCLPLVISIPELLNGNEIVTTSSESRCLYLIILMGVYWSLNPIPLPITSLLPIVLLPVLGLSSTETACSAYLRANNMLFLACLVLALAIEKSNLHQRIALKVLCCVSTKFHWMLLGFMLTSMIFSMWIVSTATVAMMLPIADEIFKNIFASEKQMKFDKIEDKEKVNQNINCNTMENEEDNNHNHNNNVLSKKKLESIINDNYRQFKHSLILKENNELELINIKPASNTSQDYSDNVPEILTEEERKICKLFYLCIAYSATIGGVSTITSNGPNLVMKDILEIQYRNQDPVDYATWLMFATPASILICIILWALFSLLYFRKMSISPNRQIVLKRYIRRKYQHLGPITFHEWGVLHIFLIMILLYMFYKPQFISGWSELFEDNQSTIPKPASAAILCVILLFLIPKEVKKWKNPDLKNEALLDWPTIQAKLEWSVLIIRGGGFALADAVKSSGLSSMVGNNLSYLSTILPIELTIVLICLMANVTIEFMRTSATASILFPIGIKLSETLKMNPLKLIIPLTASCAYAFISPVGTTSNTLIFYHGKLSIKEMILPGLLAKLVSMSLMLTNVFLLGDVYFNIDNPKPDWLKIFDENENNDLISTTTTIDPLETFSKYNFTI